MSREWYIDAFGHPIADVRAKLIDEGWFGRRTTEPSRANDLGWTRDDQPKSEHAPDHSPDHDRDQDRGIDIDR